MTILNRRHVLLTAAVCLPAFAASPAMAANIAETFVTDNIHVGFDLLNEKQLSPAQRKERFAAFLLGLTDVKRVALFLLGNYANKISPVDQDAFVAAYQDYALAVYQSYFAMYAGQTLKVLDSRERAPGDFVVRTNMVDSSSKPLEVDFRVRTDGPHPVLVDLGVGGIWLALAQRDDFVAVLAQNNGDINALIAHLRTAEKQYR